MPENKSVNLKSFLFVKAGAITDVPSTRTFSWLMILSWAFSGVTFIRCVRSHLTDLIHRSRFRSRLSMYVFRISLLQHLSISFAFLYVSTYLFHLHPAVLVTSFLRLHLIPLYFPSERFLSNLRVCFGLISGLFEKTSENPL